MMIRSQGLVRTGKNGHSLLAVYCGKQKKKHESDDGTEASSPLSSSRPLPVHDKSINLNQNAETCEGEITQTGEENPSKLRASKDLVTEGCLEIHVLKNPNKDEFKQKFEVLEPDIVYFLADCVSDTEEIGPLELSDGLISTSEDVRELFGEKLPQLVCLEALSAGKVGDALQMKGVPYVIYWKGPLTVLWANHFRQALFAGLRSPFSQVWNACQVAVASFRFYRGIWKSQSSGLGPSKNINPVLLGDAPEGILEIPRMNESVEADGSPSILSKVQIYDEEINFPLLVLAETGVQDNIGSSALEDGLNSLLMVEVIGMRLLHRVSASSPLSSTTPPARGVVTMRCDFCTSASARISLLVSGSAQICLDDQMLEYSIKKELMEKSKFVSSLTRNGRNAAGDVRKSASIACGESVTEVRFRSSSWAVQVLRQLAPEHSFRTLVALGIAGIQGFPVASFQREDVDRFLALSSRRNNIGRKDDNNYASQIPSWLASPAPSRKRQRIDNYGSFYHKSSGDDDSESSDVGTRMSTCNYVAAMKPIPHVHASPEMPFPGGVGWSTKTTLLNGPSGRMSRPNLNIGALLSLNSVVSASNKDQSIQAPAPAQILPLTCVPLKKHGCNRRHMLECTEEEFKKDVMEFLVSRGHGRLVISTDIETFPEAVLNGKRLDLYNLYKEVVSRGGFHVGNGINWRGQVFSKMHNHTILNRMTGVGNTLKKHYETYLLEYEFAHDDVDGECCLICHSTAAGDWVNCGVCGEWAHYSCDKRNAVGAFKEYAKTDGLEYICPRCCISNGSQSLSEKKQSKSPTNGFCRLSETLKKPGQQISP